MWKIIKLVIVLALGYAILKATGLWTDFVHGVKWCFGVLGSELLYVIIGIIVLAVVGWLFFRKK